jgi:tetratricopeptide (TPR) repeat protein
MRMSRPRLIALLLGFITLVVFLPAGRYGFVNYDDNEYITGNAMVKSGLTLVGTKWAFTTFSVSNWHPVTWLSHMADCELFGLNAGAHHIVNVLFHSANTALLFLVLWRLTQQLGPSALIAALFAWHPLHVESVAWISERKDVLSAFFALLTLLSYAKFVAEGQGPKARPFYAASLIFFALGLMAKPMLVTLPCVLLLLDYWPLKRFSLSTFRRALLLEKISFFALTAVACVLTLQAQHSGHAVVSLEQISFSARFVNALAGLAGYVEKLFWPADLCALYLLPAKIPVLQTIVTLAGLLLTSVLAWRWRNSRPYFLVGWLWFLGMLVPVIGLVQVGDQAMADRYTYLPSIGFFMALVFLADEFAGRLQTPAVIRFGCAGVIACGCIVATELQLPSWRDGEALFRRAVAVNPANDVALTDLGVTLAAQGRLEEAVDVYQQAEQAGSRRYQVHNNRGNALGLLGRRDESLAEYREALQLAPQIAAVHFGAGRQLAALNRFDEALQAFNEAARLDPNYAAPCLEAGKVFFKLGRDPEGLGAFSAAVRLDSGNFQTLATVAHYLAANENAAARDGQTALHLALKANEFSGQRQPKVLDILGMAYAETGDFTNAIACTRAALDLAIAVQMNDTADIQTRLALYQSRQPWRESFRISNAPGKY